MLDSTQRGLRHMLPNFCAVFGINLQREEIHSIYAIIVFRHVLHPESHSLNKLAKVILNLCVT